MSIVGTVETIAKIDTTQYILGEKQIERSNQNIIDSSDKTDKKTGSSWSSIGKSVAKGAAVAAAAVVALGGIMGGKFLKDSITAASELQSIRASFESLTGSVDTARQIISDLNKFSLSTAFSSEDINSAARTLLGFGTEADDLLKVMQQLGDIAGATGGDLSSLSLVTGQVFAQGRLQAQDYYQIINSGAGKLADELRKVVAQKTGMTDIKEAFEDGVVTADMYREALENANKEGGFAFQGAINQSKTYEGRLSNLQEGITNVGLAIIGVDRTTGDIEPGGFFDQMSKSVENLTNWVNENKEEIINFINTAVAPFIQAFQIMGGMINWVINLLKPLLDYISQNEKVMEVLKTTVVVLGAILGGVLVGAIGAVVLAVTAVSAAIEAAIKWAVDLGSMFVNLWNLIAATWKLAPKFFENIFKQIIGLFSYVGKAVGDAIGKAFKSVINGVISSVEGAINSIIDTINSVAKGIDDALPGDQSSFRVGKVRFPKLASGGIVTSATMAMIGEGSEPEAVLPLSKLDEMLGNNTVNNGGDITIQVSGVFATSKQEQRAIAEVIAKRLQEIQKSRAVGGATT